MFMSRKVKTLSSFGADFLQLPRLSRHYAKAAQIPVTECLDESLINRGTLRQPELKCTKLENGIQVVSMESDGGVSKVSVYIKAGSRYEDSSNMGITHILRNSAFLTNKTKSALGIIRELQQHGISLGVTNTRDYFVYSGTCVRDSVDPLLENVASSIHGPLFQKWEIPNALEQCASERDNLQVHLQPDVLDKLHGVAFRKGLGNSIYCEEHKSYSGEEMTDYVQNNFVGERISVVAIGCEHDSLVKSVSSMLGSVPKGTSPSEAKQKYFGGERRVESESNLNHVAFAAEGASHVSKDLLPFGVLQYLMGASSFIKWGSNTVSSRLNRAAASASDSPFMASSLNVSHADNGLFGFYTITEPKDTTQVVKAVINEFKAVAKGNFTDEELARAKNQLKSGVLMASENRDAMLEDIAHQMISNGAYKSPGEVCTAVDAVTKAQITKAVQAMFNGKGSLVVSGDCSFSPYYDELV